MDENLERTTEQPGPKPKKKTRKVGRRPRPRLAEPQAAPPDFLEGLSDKECPFECDVERCVITHIGICGHPYKGELQSALQNKPDVVKRRRQAQKVLLRAKVDQA
jgi:hypothetical protein